MGGKNSKIIKNKENITLIFQNIEKYVNNDYTDFNGKIPTELKKKMKSKITSNSLKKYIMNAANLFSSDKNNDFYGIKLKINKIYYKNKKLFVKGNVLIKSNIHMTANKYIKHLSCSTNGLFGELWDDRPTIKYKKLIGYINLVTPSVIFS